MERRAPHNILTKINNLYIIAATSTLPHKKKELNGISVKKNIIYTKYIIIYYPLPLKNRQFSRSMILVFGQYEE